MHLVALRKPFFGFQAVAGAVLVACLLAGLSALETYRAGVRVGAQFGAPCGCAAWLTDRLTALRGPGEGYSDVILRLATMRA
jgi:hypothetical protein